MKFKVDIFLILVLICTTTQLLHADTLNDYKQKLGYERSSTSSSNADVTIREDDSARIALTELGARAVVNSTNGYRIGIYFDNGASARVNAQNVKKECEKLFPDIIVSMNYDNPYFKVSAGYCIEEEEAIILLNRIQKHFPKAYLMREVVTTEDLQKSYEKESSQRFVSAE